MKTTFLLGGGMVVLALGIGGGWRAAEQRRDLRQAREADRQVAATWAATRTRLEARRAAAEERLRVARDELARTAMMTAKDPGALGEAATGRVTAGEPAAKASAPPRADVWERSIRSDRSCRRCSWPRSVRG